MEIVLVWWLKNFEDVYYTSAYVYLTPKLCPLDYYSSSQEDPLEKEMAAHSSIHAWKIPRTEEPGGLQSIGLQRDATQWLSTHAQGKPRIW